MIRRGVPLEGHHRQADHVGREPRTRLDRLARRTLHEDQVGDGDAVVRIDVAGQRRERAVRHPHRHGGVCSNESGIDSSSTLRYGDLPAAIVRVADRPPPGSGAMT